MYRIEANNPSQFDKLFNLDDYKTKDHYKMISINIECDKQKTTIGMIGSYYTYDTSCGILEGDILTILQDDAITQLHLPDINIIKHKKLNCTASNYAIFDIDKGYIIYGEMDITMLDKNLDMLWTFSGDDVFIDGRLLDDKICLYDASETYYEIDFEGRQIK